MLACLLNLLAMASVNVCRLCTNVEKTINLFSRAGMRNEWSSRISAMLDITIEDDEGVSPYATSAHVDCHYRRRPLKIVSHSGSWPYRRLMHR